MTAVLDPETVKNWIFDGNADMKVCFVTTGATAPFTGLIEAILRPESIEALAKEGYTHLLVQYGTAKATFTEKLDSALSVLQSRNSSRELVIGGMDFDGGRALEDQFRLVQSSKGMTISHAGSGTILAALRYQIPLIVVPNTALLDNHQEDLAVAMERSNYLIRGDVNDLVPAIRKAEAFRTKMSQFPPITSGKHRETKSFAALMDETMGFE